MIFAPTNVFPTLISDLGTIDARGIWDEEESKFNPNEFSFQINGSSPVRSYSITIFENTTESKQVWTSGTIQPSQPLITTDFRGIPQRVNVTIPINSGLVNGMSYKWNIVLSAQNALAEPVVRSIEYAFLARETPQLIVNIPDIITSRNHMFEAVYQQTEDGTVKHFQWVIRNNSRNNTVILDTGQIFSQDIRTYIDSLVSNATYTITLTVVDQHNRTLVFTKQFKVEYSTMATGGFVSAYPHRSTSSVELDWFPTFILGQPEGEMNFILDEEIENYYWLNLHDESSSVRYSIVNGKPMQFPATISHTIKFKTPLQRTNENRVIYRANGVLGGEPYFIEVRARFWSIWLNVNDEREYHLCGHLSDDDVITVAISNTTATVKVKQLTDALLPSQSLWTSQSLYPRFGHTIGIAETQVNLNINPLAIFTSLTLLGPQTVSYLWIRDIPLSDSQLDEIVNSDDKPHWDDHTLLLASFQNHLEAGQVIVETFVEVEKWMIYREENGIATYVGEVPAWADGIVDYFAGCNNTYVYYSYPVAEDIIGTPLVSEPVVIDWKEWMLLTSNEQNYTGDTLSMYSTYRFFANLQVSDISNHNQPVVLQNFSRFPKIQYVNHNYLGGTLSTLIGETLAECSDEDDGLISPSYSTGRELEDSLYELSTDGRRKFLKDPQGRIFEVAITAPITKRPNDSYPVEYSDFSVTWTQVGDINDIAMFSVVVIDEVSLL